MEKRIFIKDIGNITVRKNKLAKSIRLKIIPKKGLVVTIPAFCAYEEAYRAIEFRKLWIQKHLNEIKELEENDKILLTQFPLNTYEHTLHIEEKDIENYEVETVGKTITIYKSSQILFESSKNQEYLKFLISEIYRFEAKKFIPKRVQFFAQLFKLNYNRVSIKNQKTRWGSCSSQNNLNFNLNLMKLPEHLRDYVILHELAHTIEKNHQESFWKLLDSFTDKKAKKLDKELNQFNHLVGLD